MKKSKTKRKRKKKKRVSVNKLIPMRELADLWRISLRTLHYWRQQNIIKSYERNGRIWFTEQEIERMAGTLDPLATKQDVMERYDVSLRTVDRWIAAGKISTIQLSDRIIRFSPADIVEFEEENPQFISSTIEKKINEFVKSKGRKKKKKKPSFNELLAEKGSQL